MKQDEDRSLKDRAISRAYLRYDKKINKNTNKNNANTNSSSNTNMYNIKNNIRTNNRPIINTNNNHKTSNTTPLTHPNTNYDNADNNYEEWVQIDNKPTNLNTNTNPNTNWDHVVITPEEEDIDESEDQDNDRNYPLAIFGSIVGGVGGIFGRTDAGEGRSGGEEKPERIESESKRAASMYVSPSSSARLSPNAGQDYDAYYASNPLPAVPPPPSSSTPYVPSPGKLRAASMPPKVLFSNTK